MCVHGKHDRTLIYFQVVPSSTAFVVFASFIMGVGTGLCEVQTYALLGSVYANNADCAFAILKVCHHGCVGLGFSYAGFLPLYWQLGILFVLGVLGAASFTVVDFQARRKADNGEGKDKQYNLASLHYPESQAEHQEMHPLKA